MFLKSVNVGTFSPELVWWLYWEPSFQKLQVPEVTSSQSGYELAQQVKALVNNTNHLQVVF